MARTMTSHAADSLPSNPASRNLLGTKLNPMTVAELLQILAHQIAIREQCIIAYQNLHGMHLSYIDERFFNLHQRPNSLVFIDGFPIYLLCRVLGREVKREQRITGNDFIWPLLALAEQNAWRVYFLGSEEGVFDAAAAVIRKRAPSLEFRGHHGYFDSAGRAAVVTKDISEFDPDLLLVCMGMPRQERWIYDNAARLNSTSFCAMGAILEYISGYKRIPPRWLGPIGLEWLFRLIENPGDLWYRYLVEPWVLLANVLLFRSKRP